MTAAEAQAILNIIAEAAKLAPTIIQGIKDLFTHNYGADSWEALAAQCEANIATTAARMGSN